MKTVKNILGPVFALWAILWFIITMLILFIPFLIIGRYPEPKRSMVFYHYSVVWMDVWFFLVFVRRIFKGRDNFQKGQNYVVVCNHNSFMDVPLTSPGIPGANKTIAKIEMAKIPIFGIIYRLGSVLVNRKSEQSRKQSFNDMKEVLRMGLHMCIYPEGTRNKTAEPIQKFYDGAFRLAIDAGKPVIPAVIFYTAIVLPRNKTFYFWPHRVEMHFLPPVSPGNKTTEQFRDEVFNQMRDYYVANLNSR